MPRKKEEKTFFKIKEKLVFIPPEKLFGRKLTGIICLVCGSLILTVSLVYFYVIPKFFPAAKGNPAAIKEEQPTFVPRRILIPYLGLDFPVENDVIETELPLKNFVVEKGTEILVLSQDSYKDFQVTQVTIQDSSSSSTLRLNDQGLKLFLQTKIEPPKTLIIEAENVE